ncbi:E3 ubiquitin-protein ligase PRT1 [Amborella trichopoda]|uniref:RING-type domain-containing protein n=1 Tax=Amborella trichopoda TaxID=13333 RepID=U5D8V3_AMBTC|nr:E3 ubiquitin-protein ligase PRT1 [Amborella trichopoda]XP_020531032.1 E3 ubiquitin-protein ligase PRT1 [Amborella trichopoda]ERN18909.1 hypothetical protein AMTR_s00067p00170490 [Amborella trichopoda]|eukprot:XP_006857442.1 E3 ubiquitin-protein ligase PRT1 [Amborella trichopoda]
MEGRIGVADTSANGQTHDAHENVNGDPVPENGLYRPYIQIPNQCNTCMVDQPRACQETLTLSENERRGRASSHFLQLLGGADEVPKLFQCFVCLELVFKPVVLACGHLSCFWCSHRIMNSLGESHCAICRRSYIHFPNVCEVLHFLVMKIFCVAYKARAKQVLEEEKKRDVFSPQFDDNLTIESAQNDSIEEKSLNSWTCKEVSTKDALCLMCKELLYRPVVLNCGHVYCEFCAIGLLDKNLKCRKCLCLHPGGFPKVCLELEHFLKEAFSEQYAHRRNAAILKLVFQHQYDRLLRHKHEDTSTSKKEDDEMPKNTSGPHAFHFGVGCDSCGMYPIIGERYRCKDCHEIIGFDLCGSCYNTNSKLPGRFNQQHRPEHLFELTPPRRLNGAYLQSLMEGPLLDVMALMYELSDNGSDPRIISEDDNITEDPEDNGSEHLDMFVDNSTQGQEDRDDST